MPSMCFDQTTVTQNLATEPACLAAKDTFYRIADFRNQAIALYLSRSQWLVLQGLILNAVFDAAWLQSIAMFLTAISFVGMNTGSQLDSTLSSKSGSGLLSWRLAAVVATTTTNPSLSTTVCVAYNQRPLHGFNPNSWFSWYNYFLNQCDWWT